MTGSARMAVRSAPDWKGRRNSPAAGAAVSIALTTESFAAGVGSG